MSIRSCCSRATATSLAGGSRAASRRARHSGLNHLEPAADDRRRTAASGRRLHRPRRTPIQSRPRSLLASAPARKACLISRLAAHLITSLSIRAPKNGLTPAPGGRISDRRRLSGQQAASISHEWPQLLQQSSTLRAPLFAYLAEGDLLLALHGAQFCQESHPA